MRKVLVFVIFVSLLFGGGFVEKVDAVAAPVCGPCNVNADCLSNTCQGDPDDCDEDEDGVCQNEKQGVCQDPGTIRICNPLQTGSFTGIVNNILTILFNFALVLTPIMVVVAGIMFVTAAGNPERVSTAKRVLLWTVVGFAIIILARGLIVVIKAIIGF